MSKRAKKASIVTLENRILAALGKGQMQKRMICAALEVDYHQIDGIITRMVRAQKILFLGYAHEAGYTNCNRNAWVYGPPGTKLVTLKAKPTLNHEYPEDIRIAQPRTIGAGWSHRGPW